MKTISSGLRVASFLSIALGIPAVRASFQPSLPPDPILHWTPYADTGAPAPKKFSTLGATTSFTSFNPPVIMGDPAFGGSTMIAFKARMAVSGTVTSANDEGIWANFDPGMFGAPGSTIWLKAQESDAVSSGTLGNSGRMLVRALQPTPTGGLLFNTNSSVDPSPNLSVYEGGTLNAVAGPNVGPLTSGGLAVSGHDRIAVWTTDGTNDGTRAWDVTTGAVHTLTAAPLTTLRWTAPRGNPRVQCSPAISYYGAVAHRARSVPSSGIPASKRDYIEVVPLISGGFFTTRLTVVRAGDPAPTGETFGVFHPVLMAVTGGPNVAPTVCWQMSSMTAGEGGTAGAGVPVGSPVPDSGSLWCWRKGSIAEIARVGQAAPEIAGRTFRSFYALHLVDDDSSWPDSLCFYGAILDNGKYAIYMRSVSTVSGITTLSADRLIATDSPGAPAAMDVAAIHGPAGSVYSLAALHPWFSVDIFGNVLMKATLAGTPPAQSQCLLTAKRGTDGHGLRMRAQSGGSANLPTLSHGFQTITNFAITSHEQGSPGRGQGIFEQTVGALVHFTGGSGVYSGF